MPWAWKDNPALGRWVGRVRQQRRDGTLDPEREKELTDMGFVWSFPNTPIRKRKRKEGKKKGKKKDKKKEHKKQKVAEEQKLQASPLKPDASAISAPRQLFAAASPPPAKISTAGPTSITPGSPSSQPSQPSQPSQVSEEDESLGAAEVMFATLEAARVRSRMKDVIDIETL